MKDGAGEAKIPHRDFYCNLPDTTDYILKSQLAGFVCKQREHPWVCQPSGGIASTGNVGPSTPDVGQTLGSQGSWELLSGAVGAEWVAVGASRSLFHNSTPKFKLLEEAARERAARSSSGKEKQELLDSRKSCAVAPHAGEAVNEEI